MREGELLLLCQHAGVTELLHMLDTWHALHHLFAAELPQGLEVEVPKALVIPPCVIVVARCKTEVAPLARGGRRDNCIICSPWREGDIGDPNAQHPVVELHTRAVFIELSQIDDGVSQRGDVVDASE